MYDSKLWHTDMQEKGTLTIYRKYKHSIKGEQNLYYNSAGIYIGVLRGGGQGGLAPPPLKLVKV